jgi:hypothetical protein
MPSVVRLSQLPSNLTQLDAFVLKHSYNIFSETTRGSILHEILDQRRDLDANSLDIHQVSTMVSNLLDEVISMVRKSLVTSHRVRCGQRHNGILIVFSHFRCFTFPIAQPLCVD